MGRELEVGVAATVVFGPFLSDTDGKTAVTNLTTAATSVFLSKNGGDLTAKHDATALAHAGAGAEATSLGYYHVVLDTSDIDTAGEVKVAMHLAGCLPVWESFAVLTRDAWQSKYGDHVLSTFDPATDTVNLDPDYDAAKTAAQAGEAATAVGTLHDLSQAEAQTAAAAAITAAGLATAANLAVVDGVVDAIKAKTDAFAATATMFVCPVSPTGDTITLVQGDDYYAVDGRSLPWTDPGWWPSLVGATVKLNLVDRQADVRTATDVAVTSSTPGSQAVAAELDAIETALEAGGVYAFDVEATLAGSGHTVTLASGTVVVLPSYTPPVVP
jgi:hypothetical protein